MSLVIWLLGRHFIIILLLEICFITISRFVFSALLQLGDLISMEQRHVVVTRTNIIEDLLLMYRDETILNCKLHVEFTGEPGDDFGGLTKEMFTVFWNEVTRQLFTGEHCVIPVSPLHRIKPDAWKFVSLGRILSHTMALTGNIPPNLSPAFLVSLIFSSDVNEQCLLEDFLQFVTDREQKLLCKAMADFNGLSTNEMDRLVSFFQAHRYLDIPRVGQIRNQLLTIAEQVMVQVPAPLCKQIRRGIPERHMDVFWAQLSIDHIRHLLLKQRPTPDKVADVIVSSVENINDAEETTLYYFKEFVGTLNQDLLVDFLLFSTGSIHQPTEIKVAFNGLCGAQRRPCVHTCSNLVELPTTYISYQEFRREFTLVLTSPESYEYSTV
jgi:hypothetical protein